MVEVLNASIRYVIYVTDLFIGAVGIEMASELKLVEPEKSITLIHSRERLLSSEPLPDEFKDRSFLVLQETGVKVMLNRRVMKIDPGEISDGTPLFKLLLDDGSEILTSHVIKAISHSIPTTSYLPEASLDLEGYVKIGPTYATLQDLRMSILTYHQIKLHRRCPQRAAALRSGRHCSMVRHQTLRRSNVYGICRGSEYTPAAAPETLRQGAKIRRDP